MIFERVGRIFAPKTESEDPHHFRTSANLSHNNSGICKGRSMVGYSRRWFLGMVGSVAVNSLIPGRADPTNRFVSVWNGDYDYSKIIWPKQGVGPSGGIYHEEVLEHYIPFAGPYYESLLPLIDPVEPSAPRSHPYPFTGLPWRPK